MTTLFSCSEINDFLKNKGANWLASLRNTFQATTGVIAESAGFAPDGDKFYFRFGVDAENFQKILDIFKNLGGDHELVASLPDGLATKIEVTRPFYLPPREISPA